jgi:hypothetical protein
MDERGWVPEGVAAILWERLQRNRRGPQAEIQLMFNRLAVDQSLDGLL